MYIFFSYRQLFHAPDGGTIALDWLMSCDGKYIYIYFFSRILLLTK
jgi:hypothetical protein